MLVSTMTPEEVHKEIYRDYEILKKTTTLSRLAMEYARVRKKEKIKPADRHPVWNTIKTKAKNNWLIKISKDEQSPLYLEPENCATVLYTYYQSERGFRLFAVSPSGILKVYNGHFFTRYTERTGNTENAIVKAVKLFFTNNGDGMPRIYKKPGDTRVYFTEIYKEGVGLGHVEIYGTDAILFVNNTFIANETLSTGQADSRDKLRYIIAKRLLEEGDTIRADEQCWLMAQETGIMKDDEIVADLQSIIHDNQHRFGDSSWYDIINVV